MLSDLVIETAPIKIGQHQFEVSGVSFDMLAQLWLRGDRTELKKAVEELEGIFQDAQTGTVDIKARVGTVLTQLPALAAQVIAIAAGEPDQYQKVLRLPMPSQLDTLMEIGRLTFTEDDSIKNFVGGLLNMMEKMKTALEDGMQAATPKSTGLPR
jgi:hypothetical protein